MGILAKRFPEYAVILQVFRDEITREAWMAYYAGFAAEDSDRFVTFLDPSADLSGLDIASGPELKRVVACKLREAYGDKPVVSIFVPGSPEQETYLKFWCAFEAAGDGHPALSVVVPDFAAACELLDLPADAARVLEAAAKDHNPNG